MQQNFSTGYLLVIFSKADGADAEWFIITGSRFESPAFKNW